MCVVFETQQIHVRRMPQCRPFVMLATLLTLGLMCVGRAAPADGSIDVIVVLAGGVGDDGVPHATVMRRLEHAAQLYKRQMESSHGKAPAIVCNWRRHDAQAQVCRRCWLLDPRSRSRESS